MLQADVAESQADGRNAASGRQRRDSSPAQLAFADQLPVSTQVTVHSRHVLLGLISNLLPPCDSSQVNVHYPFT